MRPHAWKAATKAELDKYFRSRRSPRLMLTAVLMLTGVAGLGLCRALLACGVFAMWLRYPLATVGGYGAFLLLMRAWVAWEHYCFDHRALRLPQLPEDADLAQCLEPVPAPPQPSKSDRGMWSWLDWLDCGSFDFPDAEGCLFGILVAVVLAVLAIAGFAIADASALVADVFLDSFLVTLLYRKLRATTPDAWLGTAIRRTYPRALWVAALLAVAGACLQGLAPGCHSIGPAVRKVLGHE